MSNINYRPEIDGLRALAIIGVVFYHAGVRPIASGFVGVDVFFAISGYLITSLILRERLDTGRVDLMGFYARRVRRLLPILIVVCVVTVLLSVWFVPGYSDKSAVAFSAASSFVFAANFYFQHVSGGYFDADAATMPLLHLWSLGVEEQFYLVWPIFLILVTKTKRSHMVAATFLLATTSIGFAEYLIREESDSAFFQMLPRLWELAAGGLIAMLPSRPSRGALAAVYVGAAIIIAAMCELLPTTHFPGMGAAGAVLGAALILWGVHGQGNLGGVGYFLRWRPMVMIGRISYSLYLWHWPLLAVAKANKIGSLHSVDLFGLVVLALILSIASYRWIEQPWRQRGGDRSRRTVVTGIFLSVVLAVASLATAWVIDSQAASGPRMTGISSDRPLNMERCHAEGGRAVPNRPDPSCASRPGKIDTVIWGDSHALAWQPFAWAITDGAAINVTRDACAPVLDWGSKEHAVTKVQLCRQSNDMAMDFLAEQRPHTLIIAARWHRYLESTDANAFASKLVATIARASKSVGRVLIIEPTPELSARAQQCVDLNRLDACAEPKSRYLARTAIARKVLAEVARTNSNVELIDPLDYFCNKNSCGVLRSGVPLYWDSNHVSVAAATGFAEQWKRRNATRCMHEAFNEAGGAACAVGAPR
ncbi:acyltransferase [Lysobacter capsici]|uniref:acyltransferase family protein n=1 Tax=Lysobacter capsici TaxID=435897 RepID=UPI001780DD11|nr:acyltransferase family protein [Lysobacter capsici]UOF16498.1 acyltransferase [Lysobacter capsici]